MARLVLIKQAAEHTGYTLDHIRHLLNDRLIEGEKVGWIWLVDLDSLQAYETRMNEVGKSKYRPKRLRTKKR